MEHLKVPSEHCCKARKISDDLKWGPHLGGTHDDHVGVQEVSVRHHERGSAFRVSEVREGQKPAILKK
jgi:hypothetical protein